ncbi:membrane protein insertase YidC [Tolumonas lignilytica]|uniref:membrane protein insertase YidC n=1 Tax=Tolumonas lignilytica TaxID=1283284 RepID=UPI000467BCB0|nr:membrane protein insertase YidC [Tolumonas lignilytica]
MQPQRNLLLIGLLLVTFMLWQSWMVDKAPKPAAPATAESSVPASSTGDVPNQNDASKVKHALLTLRSDVLELTVDTLGGDVVEAKLLKQTISQDSNQPFVLLEKQPQHSYIAQSGLIGRDGIDNQAERPVYTANGSDFALADGKDELVVPMTFTDAKGNIFTKRFVLKRNSYAVGVDYQVKNVSAQPLEVQFYGQLKQTIADPANQPSSPGMMSSAFHGAAYSSAEHRYEKVKFANIGDAKLDITTPAGWVGMMQHYFVTAWTGKADAKNHIYSNAVNVKADVKDSGDAIIGIKLPLTTVAANSEAVVGSSLWIGPKLQEQMAATAQHLDLTVDYGWLWFIAQPLFKLLKFLHSLVNNWGVAIVLITLIVRGGMYPLSKAQYTSMAKMRMLQPKLAALRERFGEDRQKMSQAMMELYKEEKVNPLGGCFPLLVQMPIFIALYWTLMESVELRHAPFMLWLTDLSAKDPYYVLPLLMGASMWYIQKMSPTTVTDPMQQKVMQFMPIIFTFMFLWFPSGLTLYWVVSNIVTITQQTLIFRQLEKKGLHTRKK